MPMTRRGRAVLGVAIALALVAVAGLAVAALGRLGGANPVVVGGSSSFSPPPPPPTCPLTGLEPSGSVPNRPALAVKVENLPAARPQTGLSWADIVYEEPVEGGITRFIAVYQCRNASRIEPVRSARLTDPDILIQFGHPLFAYAGAVPEVVRAVRKAGLADVNYNVGRASGAYHRDPARPAPHNLFTSTRELYAAGRGLTSYVAPDPIFTYSATPPAGKRVRVVHVPFSSSSDVYWKWSAAKRAWMRFHGTQPHVSSDGTQFRATNVIVQMVQVTLTDITDANGVRSPRVISVGHGKAYVFRNGQVIVGTWERPSLRDVTRFLDRRGKEIPLAPGVTWVELVPLRIPVTFG